MPEKTATMAGVMLRDSGDLVRTIRPFVPSLSQGADRIDISSPGYGIVMNERDYQDFLTDSVHLQKRKALLASIQGVLDADAKAKEQGSTLREAALEMSRRYREALENAWVTILEQNREKEVTMRWAALFFSNMQDSARAFRGKIFAVDASPEEIASDAGREMLRRELSNYVDRPDPRSSRAYVLVCGWVGSTAALHRLARVVHDHRAILVSDGPAYESMEDLQIASGEGGLLESLAGDSVELRHTILLANPGRARRRIAGRFARESRDLHVPVSGPWFGSYLDNIVRGLPWRPPVGYRNPIVGLDGALLDLKLNSEGFSLYLKHRLNPLIPLAAGSNQVVVWGPDALCRVDGGVQIGVAVVEMLLVRYAEWIVNQYGLLADLSEAEDVVRKKLAEFLSNNAGAGRMFQAGSKVTVMADSQARELVINFDLLFWELMEKAKIQVRKPAKREEFGKVHAQTERRA